MKTDSRCQKIAVTGATGRVGSPLVEILERRGHDVVAIARSRGVDVVSGDGLEEALADPDATAYAEGAALPNPGAKLAGPSFEEWLAAA